MARNKFATAISTAAVISALVFGASAPAHADDLITFSVDAPHVQGTYVSGAILENFNSNAGSGCSTQLAFGSYTGNCEHPDAIYYAGASSELSTPVTGGVGTPFIQVPMGGAMDITLNQPANYLGFHWEAGNQFDRVQLFNNDTELANFSFQTLMDALNNSTLTSTGGTVYQQSDYITNPVTGVQNEPYAYVHIFATAGAKFNRVVISEDAGSPGIFELDNMAVAYEADENTAALVQLDSVTITSPATKAKHKKLASTGTNSAAELAVGALLLAAGATVLVRRRRA
jgi:LPXTG-motif cell wall-anchored protein